MKNSSKILLINTPQENTIHAGVDDEFVDIIGYYPPLGLLYLGTVLKNNNYEIKIIDCVPQKIDYTELKNQIIQYEPTIVGITTYTTSMSDVLTTANLVKEVNDKIVTVIGGHHPTLYPNESIKYDNIDFIIQGEGEYSFLQLVQAIENNEAQEKLEKIEGIGFKIEKKIFLHKKQAYLKNLDELPIPERKLLPIDTYKSIVGRNEMVATIMSSRGCPFRCTFCYTPNKKYRSRSTENIIEEIKYLISVGFKELFFFDDLFALQEKKVLEFAKALTDNNIEIEWSFRARISTISEKMIKAVKQSGCHRIQFGIESGVDSTLLRIKKDTKSKQIRNAIKLCKENKITTIGSFLIGVPDESENDIMETIKFSRNIGLDFAQYNVLIPFPFTAIYVEGLRKNIFSHDYWKEFADNPIETTENFKVQYWTKEVSEKRLFKIAEIAFKKFYFRPSVILKKLKTIKSFREFKNNAIGALSVLKFKAKN